MPKWMLSVLVLALLVALPVQGKEALSPVQQLQIAKEGRMFFACTTWAHKVGKLVQWVTDFHCVEGADGEADLDSTFYIGGVKAILTTGNKELDLATLTEGPAVEGYVLADKPPVTSEPATVLGFPFGATGIFFSKGYVSLAYGRLLSPTLDMFQRDMTYVQASGGPGSSGSPVLNAEGQVIGIVQWSPCWVMGYGFCSEMVAAPWKDLRLFLLGKV